MVKNRIHIVFFLGLFAAGTALLFLGGPDYYSARSLKYSWDIGHIAYFALLTIMLTRWCIIANAPFPRQWITVLIIITLIGSTTELMQSFVSRTPSIGDVLRNAIGALLVLAFCSTSAVLRPVALRRSMQAAVALILSVQLWPLTKSLVDEANATHNFPILSDFETPFEQERWTGKPLQAVETILSFHQYKMMKITFNTDHFSGVGLKYFEGDWSTYKSLKIDLYNPELDPLNVTCRINDLIHVDGYEEYEDRFNRNYHVVHGWNHIEIDLEDVKTSPAKRYMDMSNIKGIGLYVVSQPTDRTLYLNKVELSR